MLRTAALLTITLALALVPRVAFAADAASAPPDPDDVPTAPEPPPVRRGLQLGARLGYALPTGVVAGSTSGLATRLSALETASVPLGIDVGYRASPVTYIGGTLVWGAGIDPNGVGPCKTSGVSCSRQDAQLRFEARFYLAPRARTSGWLAVGAGWEVATFSQSHAGSSVTSTLTGFVLPDLEIGFDVRGRVVALGPYLGVSFGEFVTHGVNPAAAPASNWIDDLDEHAWVTLGVRGSYGPW